MKRVDMADMADVEEIGGAADALLRQTDGMPPDCCCRYKEAPRDPALRRALQSRLNRIIGQLGGVKGMLDDERYCGDILIQVAAAQRALQSFGYALLEDHLESCVREKARAEDPQVMRETVELIKKLK